MGENYALESALLSHTNTFQAPTKANVTDRYGTDLNVSMN